MIRDIINAATDCSIAGVITKEELSKILDITSEALQRLADSSK